MKVLVGNFKQGESPSVGAFSGHCEISRRIVHTHKCTTSPQPFIVSNSIRISKIELLNRRSVIRWGEACTKFRWCEMKYYISTIPQLYPRPVFVSQQLSADKWWMVRLVSSTCIYSSYSAHPHADPRQWTRFGNFLLFWDKLSYKMQEIPPLNKV